jgi:hypothetical protein
MEKMWQTDWQTLFPSDSTNGGLGDRRIAQNNFVGGSAGGCRWAFADRRLAGSS